MAKLTMAERRALPKSDFAVPSKAPGPGSYPIPDAGHAKAAGGRATQFGTPAVKAAVKKKIKSKGFAPKSRPLHKQVASAMLGGY